MEFLTGVVVIIGFWATAAVCFGAYAKANPGRDWASNPPTAAESDDALRKSYAYQDSLQSFDSWDRLRDRINQDHQAHVRQLEKAQTKPAKPTRTQRAYARRQQEIAEANAAAARFASLQQSLGIRTP